MSSGIYLVRGDDELVEMRETPYEAEDVLQQLIAKFPSLLAGDQFDAEVPRRWLLAGREASLPDDEDAAGRWSVDHLFLDQDAVPTLVEVKRSSDTRIRRAVVGQMLDYAANGVVYWLLEQLRELFVRQCERDERDPEEVAQDVAGEDVDVEEWWQRAGDNLRSGKVRMVFVSDEIPRELRRVVEFLNGQMNPAEVIAIEVKQYLSSGGMRTLVPRVIGQTADVEARKGRRTTAGRRRWDESRSSPRSPRNVARTRRASAASCTTGLAGAGGAQPLAPAASTDRGFPSSKRSAASIIRSRSTATAGLRSSSSICATARPSTTSRFASSCLSRSIAFQVSRSASRESTSVRASGSACLRPIPPPSSN